MMRRQNYSGKGKKLTPGNQGLGIKEICRLSQDLGLWIKSTGKLPKDMWDRAGKRNTRLAFQKSHYHTSESQPSVSWTRDRLGYSTQKTAQTK